MYRIGVCPFHFDLEALFGSKSPFDMHVEMGHMHPLQDRMASLFYIL